MGVKENSKVQCCRREKRIFSLAELNSLKKMGSEVLVQLFKCCAADDGEQQHAMRRRIDRSMIGHPTDFRHTGHIGTNDLNSSGGSSPDNSLDRMQGQMRSKGGYEGANVVSVPHIVNARAIDEARRK